MWDKTRHWVINGTGELEKEQKQTNKKGDKMINIKLDKPQQQIRILYSTVSETLMDFKMLRATKVKGFILNNSLTNDIYYIKMLEIIKERLLKKLLSFLVAGNHDYDMNWSFRHIAESAGISTYFMKYQGQNELLMNDIKKYVNAGLKCLNGDQFNNLKLKDTKLVEEPVVEEPVVSDKEKVSFLKAMLSEKDKEICKLNHEAHNLKNKVNKLKKVSKTTKRKK